MLAGVGATVCTVSRRIPAIKFAHCAASRHHRLGRDPPYPLRSPSQAAPLMPPDLAGLRGRALLLVGFVAALRRSEISALDVADIAAHPSGLVLV